MEKDSLPARTTRANVHRAERFSKLDPESKEALKPSAKLKNSTEAIDAVAKIPSGEQVDFIARLERADRLRDVTRKPRRIERYETLDGQLATYYYAAVAQHIDVDSPEPPRRTAAPEILPPFRGPGLSLAAKLRAVIDGADAGAVRELYRLILARLDGPFLVESAKGMIDAEIERRGGSSALVDP
jgi:hypothetical protein